MPDQVLVDKKRVTCHLVDFAVRADEESKKKKKMIGKYLDLAREQKKLWNIKETVIPIVVDALGTAPKARKKDRERELRPYIPQNC